MIVFIIALTVLAVALIIARRREFDCREPEIAPDEKTDSSEKIEFLRDYERIISYDGTEQEDPLQ